MSIKLIYCEDCTSFQEEDCKDAKATDEACSEFENYWEQNEQDRRNPDIDEDERFDFADPGGRSALRAATPDNPRIYPCPNCGAVERLTRKDVILGYQCDTCANLAERGGY